MTHVDLLRLVPSKSGDDYLPSSTVQNGDLLGSISEAARKGREAKAVREYGGG
jgi:hypothetical protein